MQSVFGLIWSFLNLVKLSQVGLCLPFSGWFGAKRTPVWVQIDRRMVYPIWFWFVLMGFRRNFSCVRKLPKFLCVYKLPQFPPQIFYCVLNFFKIFYQTVYFIDTREVYIRIMRTWCSYVTWSLDLYDSCLGLCLPFCDSSGTKLLLLWVHLLPPLSIKIQRNYFWISLDWTGFGLWSLFSD